MLLGSGEFVGAFHAAHQERRTALANEMAIFLLGTIASFFPIYFGLSWVMSQLNGRMSLDAGVRNAFRGEFLNHLRREAIRRVREALIELAEVKAANIGKLQASPEIETAMSRASDARALMEPLFAEKTIARFDRLVNEINSGGVRNSGKLNAKIERFVLRLSPPPGRAKNSVVGLVRFPFGTVANRR